MDRKRLKFLILGSGVLISMALLMVVGMGQPGGFAYYLTVSEFLAAPDRGEDAFRVNGKVIEGSIERIRPRVESEAPLLLINEGT